jgi:heme oxygenase
MTDTLAAPLSKRLKAATGDTHDRLDTRIMAAAPFASRANYGRFLAVQYAFHRDLTPLYADPALATLLPDLGGRNRIGKIGDDLSDLGLVQPVDTPRRFVPGSIDRSTALGWLYVAEGSNLGAAFLYKAAAALGLDGDFGARHLAGHPDGRARHWREFTGALDGLDLGAEEERRVVEGGRDAFIRVHELVDRHFE